MKEGAHTYASIMSERDELIERLVGIAQTRRMRRPVSWLFPDAESVDALYEGNHGDDEDPGIWVNCTKL